MNFLETGLPFDLLLEGIVAMLLVATIGYCATIDRRLRAMRSGQDGLRDLIHELSLATGQASEAIARLRDASNATGQKLSEQVSRGRSLADELAFMLEAGNDIANRLGSIEARRAPAGIVPNLKPAAGPRQASATPVRDAGKGTPSQQSQAQHPLLDLLKRAR
ncbi:DUF6468 domain-containing protein [Parvibaculum sp.]|uniref:DUF6468 domain-containing protein n=1 Tax=Parvibaculum sp. TaxID=2024848 RepID=UPI00320DF0ED